MFSDGVGAAYFFTIEERANRSLSCPVKVVVAVAQAVLGVALKN
jgi:hypothetical protein